MTGPDGIALAVGLTTLAPITIHQHRSTTAPHHPTRRTEHGHGQDHQRAQDQHQHPGQEDGSQEDSRPRTA